MALGSYFLGADVKIPIQVTTGGRALPGYVPIVEKIIKPDSSSVPGLPAPATLVDNTFATYYFQYTPDMIGDYIILIKNTINGTDYITLENFTVSAKISAGAMSAVPRAEPK